MFEIVYDDDGRRTTDDGRRLDGYTISSPCEPNGSGELKIHKKLHFKKAMRSFTMQEAAMYMPRYVHIMTFISVLKQ